MGSASTAPPPVGGGVRVYLLAPCGENRPISCVLIWAAPELPHPQTDFGFSGIFSSLRLGPVLRPVPGVQTCPAR